MRRQPMRGDTGRRLAGALQRGPSEKLTRVSPGVYRNVQGQLTGPGGRPQQNMGQSIANQIHAAPQQGMPEIQAQPIPQGQLQQLQEAYAPTIQTKPMPWRGGQMPAELGNNFVYYPAVSPQYAPGTFFPRPQMPFGPTPQLPQMPQWIEQYQPAPQPEGQQNPPQQAQQLRNRMMRM